ncbi:MAG: FAD-dependent oxidoreductase [Steroidobacteraceae bacterium]
MLLDFREAAVPELLQTDLCIVGGGAAGIAIAREFVGSGWSVIVLESGGLAPDPRIQDLTKGQNARGDFTLHESRFRLFGGTTSVWGGWCAPLDELDFVRRDWVPHSGWPITRRELMPYYRRAQGLCQLGAYRYDVTDWPGLAATTLGLNPAKLSHRLWQLSPPTRFGETYRRELAEARNVTLLLHATATEIVSRENAEAISEIRIANLEGRHGRVRARLYVAACGGIETPRLLLLSRRVEAAGLANRHDLVGRFFMEHPHPDAGGVLISGDVRRFEPYVRRSVDNERIVLAFGPSPDAQRRLRILNSSIAVGGPLRFGPTEAWDSLSKLARAVEQGHWPASAATHVQNVLRDLDDVLREIYRRRTTAPVRGYTFTARTETAPDPANRVMLSEERDALGQQRTRLQWRLGSVERNTVAQALLLVAAEFGRLDVGRIRLNELLLQDDARWSENLSWYGHHMGTTRMSETAQTGVVDADCRVHGLANLYIAGSSVFPTAGFANPTLTILALSLRLADHLKARGWRTA